VIEENKTNEGIKKNACMKWNSNSTTPQNIINESEDYHEYSNYSSIFAENELRNSENPKLNAKNQQSMLFKKRLNNVTKRITCYFIKLFNFILDFSYS